MKRLAVLALGLACVGCGKERRPEPAQPAAAAPASFDARRAAGDPAALLAAVRRPPRELLPSFRLKGTSKTALREGGATLETLDEEALVERAASGDLHAWYGNSREHGRDLFSVGGTIWVRPRYGKFHRRPPAEPGEAERAADETGGTLAAYLELCLPGAQARDGGAATVAGRPGRKVLLARGPGVKLPAGGEAQRKWRQSATVEELEGELVLDDATGALLSGRLAARVSFDRDGKRLEMTLAATHALEEVGAPVVVTAPPENESSPTPQRQTELDDREELLSGLAPPSRKARPQHE